MPGGGAVAPCAAPIDLILQADAAQVLPLVRVAALLLGTAALRDGRTVALLLPGVTLAMPGFLLHDSGRLPARNGCDQSDHYGDPRSGMQPDSARNCRLYDIGQWVRTAENVTMTRQARPVAGAAVTRD